MTDLDGFGGGGADAVAINERGQVIGDSFPVGHGSSHAVVWQNGKLTDLGTLGGAESVTSAINKPQPDRRQCLHGERQGACRPLDAATQWLSRPKLRQEQTGSAGPRKSGMEAAGIEPASAVAPTGRLRA